MTPREEIVVTRLERGDAAQVIAAQLGLSTSYVRQIGRFYSYDAIDRAEAMRQRAIRKSTDALLAAILATGKRHI